ncbi:MAG TPA: hypothetical protein VK786_05165, partial [bacterium]|nr:hypothetical protein [bacterium]
MSAILSLGFSLTDFADHFAVLQQGDGLVSAYDVAAATDGTLYVSSHTDGFVYHFNTANALPLSASAYTQLNPTALPGGISGLCVTADQRLYVARLDQGDIVELDRSSGALLREVATAIPCASHLAQDPASGDLFVSSLCRNSIYRISDYSSGPGSVTLYTGSVNGPDGLGFGPDGTLYVAAQDGLDRVAGTAGPNPGTVTPLLGQLGLNGLAVQAGAPGLLPYLYATTSDGSLLRFDTNIVGLDPKRIFFGGQRGEGLGLDAAGRLYVTQSYGVALVDQSDGSALIGPLPTPTPSATPTATPTPVYSATATPTPSASPTATATPTALPTADISIGDGTVLVPGPNSAYVGVAASRDRLYVTGWYDPGLYTSDAQGHLTQFSKSAYGVSESYIAISPGMGGFPANWVYRTLGGHIDMVDTNGVTHPFVNLPGDTGSYYGLAFDTTGAWNYDLLVSAGYTGVLWRISSSGKCTQVAQIPGLDIGVDVAPKSFGPYGGDAFVANENGTVYWVNPQGQSGPAVNWPLADSIQFVRGSACEFGSSGYSFFTTDNHGLKAFPLSAFSAIGDRAIVAAESGPIGLLEWTGTALQITSLGDNIPREKACFVDCTIPPFPAFPAVIARIQAPLNSLQNLGPFSLSGLAGVLDQPGSYVVAAGKSNNPNSFVPLASMQNLSNVSGAFTQVDLSGQPDGVYQLRLTVQDAQQNSATDNTLVSKGKFYYQGQMQNNQFPGGFVACVENPANGHVFAASHPSTLVEFDAQGSVISSYALPGDIGGLALDSQTLYVSLQD